MVFTFAVGLFCTFMGTDQPDVLVRAIAAHDAAHLRTARLELAIRTEPRAGGDPGRTHYYTWLCTESERASMIQGDQDGIVRRDEHGDAVALEYNGPIYGLFADGDVWQHSESAPNADVWGQTDAGAAMAIGAQLLDFRHIGLDPAGLTENPADRAKSLGLPPLEYAVTADGDLTKVTATTSNGGALIWWIDVRRDYSIVRTAAEQGGRRIGEQRFTIDRRDGIWFPVRVEHYRIAAGDVPGAVPSKTIEVIAAEFNRPEHPQHLTPADIGIEVGTRVTYQDPGRTGGGIWEGRRLIPVEQFVAQLQAGQLLRGPTVQRELLRHGGRLTAAETAAPPPASAPAVMGRLAAVAITSQRRAVYTIESDWEAYTRRFIERFRLDQEQTARALEILKDCQSQATQFVRSHADGFSTADDKLAEARAGGDRAKIEAAGERARKLRAPIDEIFESKLRPRLDRLPTQSQREAAAPTPTARP